MTLMERNDEQGAGAALCLCQDQSVGCAQEGGACAEVLPSDLPAGSIRLPLREPNGALPPGFEAVRSALVGLALVPVSRRRWPPPLTGVDGEVRRRGGARLVGLRS